MRYLILSDVHAHAQQLEAVLAHAQTQGWDALIFLGDAVGYGAQPDEVLDRLRALAPCVALQGNHEAILLRALADGPSARVPPAYVETTRQAGALSAANLEFIKGFALMHLDAGWGAVHGALRKPWEYLVSIPVALANQPLMERPLYFVGHTHVPGIFCYDAQAARWYALSCRTQTLSFALRPGDAAFINPGSVAQPRDGLGPSYAIYDAQQQRVTLFRLA